MRSKLFVPGVRPELFAKALAGDADGLSLDLEDSVPESGKAQARAGVSEFLSSDAARASAKRLIVRVNAPGTPHFEDDLRAVVRERLDVVNLPKVESAEGLRAAIEAIARAESANGVAAPVAVLANIESPKGLRNAAEIASADARVIGLQLGLADLFQPFGIDRAESANVHAAMFAMRMAAAEANVQAWDAAFAKVEDDAGFQAEAARARSLGYAGKSCIHPRQVALANQAFARDAAEIEDARRIVAAAREAGAAGRGAFLLDGRMIDLPYLTRAQAIVADADAQAATKRS